MSRKEYIQELTDALRFLPEDARQAALAFYAEMLDDRMEDGMDEESAVAAMEAPGAIAARLQTENGEAPEAQAAPASPLHTGSQDEKIEFAALADSVLKNVEKIVGQATEAAENAAEQASTIAEKAAEQASESVKKPADSQEKPDVVVLPPARVGEYEKQVFTCPVDALEGVRLILANMPVRVKACGGDQVTLVYYTSQRDPYTAQIENGVLALRSNKETSHRGGFHFSFIADHFSFIWDASSPTVELSLPANALVDLTAHTSNGSIKAEGLRALCQVDLQTSNSRISLKEMRCMSLDAQTSNSRLALENVESKQHFRGKTSNARIEASGVRAGGEMVLQTSNARGVVNGAAAQVFSLITSNGGLQADHVDAGAVTLRTSNGSIRGVLPGSVRDWAIQSKTSNGSNSLPDFQAGEKPLSVRTSNGNIAVDFERT
ncbi:MAG: DUF4097 family beta strand repeat protein [Clostridia bacterium]|nr:DUF4097 family beta strand repeat protein [Clostridia bacterium]